MSDQRFLVTGAYGCIGAWVAAELVADGRHGRHVRPLDRAAAAAPAARRGRGRGDPARRRRHHRPGRARARDRRARHHARDPPRGAAGAVLPRRPAARRARQRARHGQRLRGGEGAAAASPRSLRELDRRVRRERDDGRAPEHDLRRLQARERVDRLASTSARTASRARACARTRSTASAATRALTSAPTTAMLAAAAGTALHDPVRRRGAAPARARRRRARSSPRASPATRARPCTTCPGAASSIEEIVATLDAGSIGFDDVRLPFPEEVDSTSFTAALPRLRRDAARRRRRGDRRPLPRPPRRGPRPTTRARSLMSNSSFRDDWQTPLRPSRAEGRLRRPELQRPHGRVEDGAAEGAAALRQVREHALRRRRRDRAAGRRRPRRRRGRARARDRPHREPRRRRTTRSSSSTAGRARTTSRRATTSSATASGSAARALDTFCPVGPRVVPRDELDAADLRIQQRLNGETLQDSRTSQLIFDIPTLVSYVSRGDDARARRPDPHRHARGRRRLPRAEDRAAPTATSSRSRSRGSACCGTRFAPRERRPRADAASRRRPPRPVDESSRS